MLILPLSHNGVVVGAVRVVSWLLVLSSFMLSLLSSCNTNTAYAVVTNNNNNMNEPYEIRWVSSGGGWRSMGANIAYTKVFQQVGLLSSNHCNFTSITGYSGGTWFTTQLFYSQRFYDIIVNDNNDYTTTTSNNNNNNRNDQIYYFLLQFVQSLVESYNTVVEENYNYNDNRVCNIFLSLGGLINNPTNYNVMIDLFTACNAFKYVNGDYATFISKLFRQATTDYGDPTFVDRIMNHENQVYALKHTEHQVLIGLSATSRTVEQYRRDVNGITMTYVAPSFNETSSSSLYIDNYSKVFAVSIPYLHIVPTTAKTAPYFFIGTEKKNLPLETRSLFVKSTDRLTIRSNRLERFVEIQQWDSFYTCPGWNGNVYTTIPALDVYGARDILSTPFQGGKTVTTAQMNGATSSFAAFLSGFAPSLLMQYMSTELYKRNDGLSTTTVAALQQIIKYLLSPDSVMNQASVCSQWPNQACTSSDSRFIDGGYVEGLGLAMNIGSYHKRKKYNISQPLKLIVTHNNAYEDIGVPRITSYFNTSYNKGIEPGEFLWEQLGTDPTQYSFTPIRSCQIFNTYLDYETMVQIRQNHIVDGTNVTAFTIRTQTISNPAFHVQAGQPVHLLFLQLHSDIDFFPYVPSDIQAMAVPLAQLALNISTSASLVGLVQEFLSDTVVI